MDLQLHFGDGSGSVSLEFHLVKNSKCVCIDHGGGGVACEPAHFFGQERDNKEEEKGVRENDFLFSSPLPSFSLSCPKK